MVTQEGTILVVADGLGGHSQGEVASELAATTLPGLYQALEGREATPVQRVAAALIQAAREVERAGEGRDSNMGTTAVMAVVHENLTVTVGNVGDSRCYLLSEGGLLQLTHDHNRAQELVDAGVLPREERENHPSRNTLTQVLGLGRVSPYVVSVGVIPGDRLLLCTDGLTGEMTEQEIATLLGEGTPQEAANALINAVLTTPARDNVTVVVAQVG